MRPSDIPEWHAIDGWLSPAEADRLYTLATQIRTPLRGQIVEIGTYRGRATAALAHGCRPIQAHLTTYDHYQGVVGADADWSSSPDLVAQNLATVGIRSGVVIRALASVEAAAAWKGGPIDLLFIDGSHDEQSVSADLVAWWPHVRVGSIVALHDYQPGHGDGVIAAVAPYLADGRAQKVGHVGMLAELRKMR